MSREAAAAVDISVTQEKDDQGERSDGGQAAHEGADVIAPHVEPRVERLLRQPVHRRAIDEEVPFRCPAGSCPPAWLRFLNLRRGAHARN
jgi:hypothetical protein